MFASFMAVAGFTYLFHIFQNQPSLRGYLAAASLLTSYVFQFQEYDVRMKHMWACFFAWTVYSNIYYDARTHCYGLYRLMRHLTFAFFVFAAATKQLRDGRIRKAFFWFLLAIGPDISSNVYGNALFSIIRIFACTILIMTRVQEQKKRHQQHRRVCMGVLLPRSVVGCSSRSNLIRLSSN